MEDLGCLSGGVDQFVKDFPLFSPDFSIHLGSGQGAREPI